MARKVRSLHFNIEDGVDIRYHRDHRSKKGRNRAHRATNEVFIKKKRHLEEIKQGVDSYSLRLLKRRYKI